MLSLECRNFKNLVNFYYSELRQIRAGRRASEVLSYKERKRLKQHGILTPIYGIAKIKITERAQSTLKDLESLK